MDLTPFIIILSIAVIIGTIALPILAIVMMVRKLGPPPDATSATDEATEATER